MSFSHTVHPLGEPTLIVRIRAGDLRAFESVFRAYSLDILRFGIRLLNDRDKAEDLVQEVFTWVWEHRETWNPGSSIKLYLLAAARHRALNSLRDTKRRSAIVDRQDGELVSGAPSSSVDMQMEHEERVARLKQRLEMLNEPQRTLLYLRWRHELDWREIGRILEISTDAAKKQHSRIIAMLGAEFKE